jgi:hypothetical protein
MHSQQRQQRWAQAAAAPEPPAVWQGWAILSDFVLILRFGSWMAAVLLQRGGALPLLEAPAVAPVFGGADHHLALEPLMKTFTTRDADAAYDAQKHDASPQ